MKICPVCTREYANERTTCVEDGIALVALSTGSKSRPEELLGQIVDGRYRIERIVGRGGMGTVYAATHVVVGKPVAIKVLKPGIDRSEGVLQRFIREAQTANSIRSRHIVETFDFGQLQNGSFFVVMELLEGLDLTRVMRRGLLDHPQLLHVFSQVAETLHLAHVQGIVHRDLKPDNVFLVNEAGDPLFAKLLDFGIAKILHGDPSGLTETGVILGTPYYMSPEQARAEHVDHRSDIYALGVMMYRAFTGRLPFVADSTMGVLTRHITEPPEMPSSISEIDMETERVILRCMEKLPADRYQTMEEVASALHKVQQSRGRLRDEPTVAEPRTGPWPQGVSPPGHTPLSWVPPGTPSGAHHAAGMPSGSHPASGRGSQPLIASGQRVSSGPHRPAGVAPPSSDPRAAMGSGPHPASGSGPHPASSSGPFPASQNPLLRGSGPHFTPPGSTPYPPSGAFGSVPPGYQGEQPTSRGLVTSSTSAALAPRRGALMVITGALVMVAAGAGVAFGVYGGRGKEAGPSAAEPSDSSFSAPASPPAPLETGVVPAGPAPTPAPSASAPPAASAAPSASADAAKPRAGRPPPPPAAPKTAAPTAAPAPTRRPTEIRSPFEDDG